VDEILSAATGQETTEMTSQPDGASPEREAPSTDLERQVADRTRELAALNAIATAVSGSLDLYEILNDALDETLQVMGLKMGGIYLLDEDADELHMAVCRGFRPGAADAVARISLGQAVSGRVAQSGQPIVEDLSADTFLGGLLVGGTIRSLVSVPLTSKGKVLGTLFAGSRALRSLTDQDVQLLTSIGHQIGVAIETARLYQSEQRRAEQFRLISEVGGRITSILDIHELLWQLARMIQESLGYYLVGIALIEEDELIFRAGAGGVWESPRFIPPRLKVGREGITGWVAASGEPLLVPDVRREPRYTSLPQAGEIRSEVAVPLKARERVVGVMHAQSDRLDAFDESDVVVLQALADQAAVAIENATLYEQAQQLAVLEERQRLARDLHDSVSQALYGMALYSEAATGQLSLGHLDRVAELLQQLQNTAQEALTEMRLLIYELRPPVLEEEGLVAALQARLDAVEARVGLETEFGAVGDIRLSPEVEEGLYRIAQEALNNAVKHAGARNIRVHLRQDVRSVALEIADDGVGLDPATARKRGGLGLRAMEERATELGGRLTVKSGPGEGTRVLVEVDI
jgi:signal transduction histidine kinase